MNRFVDKILKFAAAAYVKDVVIRPEQVAAQARLYCNAVGKPLLNIGAGTRSTSLRAVLIGPRLYGDVNVDAHAPHWVPHGPSQVSYASPYDLREWKDKHYGAVIACHVLERLEEPWRALDEWQRVADQVFVVVPEFWCPHSYEPTRKWYISPDLEKAYPLWAKDSAVRIMSKRGQWVASKEQPKRALLRRTPSDKNP
jgi:hypothetical protein